MTKATPDLQAWLAVERTAVDEALARFVPERGPAPAIVTEAMRYSLFAGGKRLRPLLALATAEAVADRLDADRAAAKALALPAACALELIHTYSLVHDDLPAMDDDTMRRGRPTSHVVFGEGMAILAGDGLLTEAFAVLARDSAPAHGATADEIARRQLRTVAIVAGAAGASGMVGGQALDLRAAGAAGTEVPLDAAGLRDMHGRKTGALIRASCLSGAVMAGGSDELLDAVDQYGVQIGLAFQIVDDILDVEGASEDLGKTAGKDAAAGKPTYPAIYGLEESKRLAAACLTAALGVLSTARLAGQLPAIAQWVVGRTS